MTQERKPDLVVSDLLAARPVRKLIINIADMHPGRMTLIDALDIMDVSGIDSNDFSAVIMRGTLRQKAQLIYAMAWVLARKSEPDLTFDEVCTYQIEIRGETRDDAKEKKRADAVVAVATLAGVSTEEAKQMTIQEVAAVTDLAKRKTMQRTKPRRRRIG
jgi:hypothetical protein